MSIQQELIAPSFMKRYTSLVEHQHVREAISSSGEAFIELLRTIPQRLVDHAYAEGKWTIKELLQHVIDAERVFAFRALWFARNDGQPLPGFDENAWAGHASVSSRDWNDMIRNSKMCARLRNSFSDHLTKISLVPAVLPVTIRSA